MNVSLIEEYLKNKFTNILCTEYSKCFIYHSVLENSVRLMVKP